MRFAQDLAAYGALDGDPRLEGRHFHVIISPLKAKDKPKAPAAPGAVPAEPKPQA